MNRVGYFLRRPALLLSLLFILLVVMSALFAPWLTPFDPDEQFVEGLSLEGAPLSPNSTYWLGTDLLGRDLFSRLIYGARTSLLIGVVANGTAVLIGVLVGLSAGYLQGRIGGLLMRFTDLMMAFSRTAAGDCPGGDFPAKCLDRVPGDRHGELGADR